MFTRLTTISQINNGNIIFAIVTNNLQKLKSILNVNNINNIIDNVNNYTALHYAVTMPHNDIVKFIIELGGDPYLKNKDELNSFDLSLKSGKKFLFEYNKQKQEIKIDELREENNKLEDINKKLEDKNIYINSSIDNYNIKINDLKEINNCIKNENKRAYNKIIEIENTNKNLKNENQIQNVRIIELEIINDNNKNNINKLKRELDDYEIALTNSIKKQKK